MGFQVPADASKLSDVLDSSSFYSSVEFPSTGRLGFVLLVNKKCAALLVLLLALGV